MKILLVDNDRIFLSIMEKFLHSEGYDILSAPDGLSALDMARAHFPDFIFVDHVMPNIDGATLCRILRSDSRLDSSFIVIVSAIAVEEWHLYKNLDADAYMAKVPIERMKDLVREVIQDPASARKYCSAGNVIGMDQIRPRTITKELLSSKNHLNRLLNNIFEGVIELNSDCRIVYANPCAIELFGRSGTDIMGLHIHDLFHGAREKIDGLLEDRDGDTTSKFKGVPVSYRDKHLLLSHISLLNDEMHHFIIVNDVTDIRNNEDRLLATNNFLRSILDSSHSVSIISTDLEQNITFWNKGSERLFGYKAEEVVGKEKISVLYPSSQEMARAGEIREAMKEKSIPVSFELKEVTKSGTEIWVKVHASPRINERGEICGVLGIGEDITESKRLSDELMRSEERYRSVLEANPDPVILYDMEGKVLYFNPSFTEVFGWTLEEKIGKKMDHFVPERNWPETKEMIEKVKRGKAFSGIETQRYSKNGDIIDVSISASTYTDDSRKPMGSVINLRDITHQKKLEQQFFLAQKMESIGTLAGGIAHDFNNLLMGILGRVSLMSSDFAPSHAYAEHFSAIENYIRSATSLTQQMLGVSRGRKFEAHAIDVNDLLLTSATMFGRTKKEIRILTDFHDPSPIVTGDRSQIEQVLLNFYVNAWQAMPGGGELFLETRIVQLADADTKAYGADPGSYARISVADTGGGIDADSLPRIFDPFFTTKERGRGTGLGLASAYGIIKNHSGIITVSSEVGKGSTFHVFLPLTDEKPEHHEVTTEKEAAKGFGTVLLVDDEEMIIEVGQAMLEKLGYHVLTADGGEQAVQMVKDRHHEIDLVILDLVMPGMKGEEVFDRIRAFQPSMPVLLSSGYALDGKTADWINRACGGFIQKPFAISDLSQALRNMLDASKPDPAG
ncbi:MAG: PAS domain S-box protein [Desulfobacteraceae bacterium]|nr:PAS domain S-box protein [Desulfobacteraceae bacterium]